MADFRPIRAAASASLDNLELSDGQFIITLDTKKMYVDAVVNDELSRIALGGEIDLSDYVTETEMQEAIAAIQPSGLDFSALTTALTSGTLTGLTITADTENENFDITVTNQGINFSDLSDMFTNGTLSGLTITPNAATETFDIAVSTMPTIAIDSNDEWTIDGVSTGHSSRGITPTIDSTTKHWMIGSTDTNVIAEGQDGITPMIDTTTKHWMLGETDTNVIAEGQDGFSPTVSFTNISGGRTMTVVTNDGTVTTDIMDGITSHTTTKTDLTCTVLAANWTGSEAPYTQTVTVNGVTAALNPMIDVIISAIFRMNSGKRRS